MHYVVSPGLIAILTSIIQLGRMVASEFYRPHCVLSAGI